MTPRDVAELSLQQARQGFQESVQKLVEAVGGDHEALLAASRIIAEQPVNAEGPEHIAFTYVTAAYKQLTGT